jgi:hypothetical protein
MSTMRGIVPSLGAGGSLIAASLCAFVVLSAMFAFRDEGGGTAEARSGDVTMPAGQVPAVPDTARPAVRPVRAAAPAATTRRPVRRRGVRVARPAPAAPRLTAPPRTSAPPAPPTALAPSRPRAPVAAEPVPAATPGPVENAVQQTRAAARPVTDAVPAPVDPVADAVEHVAETVDGVTRALLP